VQIWEFCVSWGSWGVNAVKGLASHVINLPFADAAGAAAWPAVSPRRRARPDQPAHITAGTRAGA